MYVRRCPRTSASSCTPPSDRRRTCGQGRAQSTCQAMFCHSRRSDKAKDRALHSGFQPPYRQIIKNAVLHLLQVVVIGVENLLCAFGMSMSTPTTSATQHRQPLDVIARQTVTRRPSATSAPAGQAPSTLPSSHRPACRLIRSSDAALRCRGWFRPARPVLSGWPSSARADNTRAGFAVRGPALRFESCYAVAGLPTPSPGAG